MLVEGQPYNHKKLLILSIFKNSNMWAKDILLHIYNIYRFNDTLYDNDDNKLDINFYFIDGMSTDGTFSTLVNYCNDKNVPNVQIHQFEPDDISDSTKDQYARYKKLAIIRNYAIKQATKDLNFTDNDYILFVDSDVKFRYDTVHELIKDMESCKADIIAPMVYIENFKLGDYYFYDVLAFRSLDNKKFRHTIPYKDRMNMKKPNEIGSVGSFYIMRYEVTKKVKYTGENDSENVEFCNNARSLGFKVFISPRLSVSHINFDEYGLEWH